MQCHANDRNTYGLTLWATPWTLVLEWGRRVLYLNLPQWGIR